ncbi:uncharacterized protein ACHE_30281A [Aspergillus chevalieri]|uniref:Uncharacterized protein n=1 Tax=Aspergillus chevalieri TaxID=182096 RepID=A0A7R7VKG8_ASPCH|nr:uncharacterized protein ACHE_30281A [Aspergillus chevalieri]BCR86294.1 hypothetical protein ACHE_30281A [Aspergillus chevalieri]
MFLHISLYFDPFDSSTIFIIPHSTKHPKMVSITNGHPGSVNTRNKAILSIFAVMAGSWMLFRAQSPNKEDILLSKADVDTTLKGQTTSGKSGRSMAHQDQD